MTLRIYKRIAGLSSSLSCFFYCAGMIFADSALFSASVQNIRQNPAHIFNHEMRSDSIHTVVDVTANNFKKAKLRFALRSGDRSYTCSSKRCFECRICDSAKTCILNLFLSLQKNDLQQMLQNSIVAKLRFALRSGDRSYYCMFPLLTMSSPRKRGSRLKNFPFPIFRLLKNYVLVTRSSRA